MKNVSRMVLMILAALLLGSCDESKGEAFVYGNVSISPGETADMHGSLSESGNGDYFGYCKFSNNKFEFTVGHKDLQFLEDYYGDAPTYISVAGIAGPPKKGVFDFSDPSNANPDPKSDPGLATTFSAATVKNNEDEWKVTASKGECEVTLFAVPDNGEVIFDDGLNKTFDFYVKLGCASYPDAGLDGQTLRFFEAEFYFENCS